MGKRIRDSISKDQVIKIVRDEERAISQNVPTLREINRLVPKIAVNNQNLSAICIEAKSFYGGSKELSKQILENELTKIEERYQREQDNIKLANLIHDITGWAVSGAAAVVSLIATPAAGAVVSTIGGIALGAAEIAINEIAAGIQRGEVDPKILDIISLVAKYDFWIGLYEEKYYAKSSAELRTLIFKLYESYEKMLLIPEKQGIAFARLGIFPFSGMTAEEIEERIRTGIGGKNWIAEKNRLEIMLSVACSLYAEKTGTVSATIPASATKDLMDKNASPQKKKSQDPVVDVAENEEQIIFDEETSDGSFKGKKALALIGVVAATAAAYLL